MGPLPSQEAQDTVLRTAPIVVYFSAYLKAKTALLPALANTPFNLRCHGAFGRNIAHDGGRHQGPTTGIDQRFAFTQAAVPIAPFELIVARCHPVAPGWVEWLATDLYCNDTTPSWLPRVVHQA